MKTLLLTCLIFLAAIFFAANAKKVCLMNQETIMTDAEQCMARHFELDLAIMRHMNDLSSLLTPDFLCKYKSDLADVFECLVVKFADCVPGDKQQYLAMIPSKKRVEETLSFICQHKNELKNDCLDGQLDAFKQCYMGRIQSLSSSVTTDFDPQKIICSVVRSEEQCIDENKGSCSSNFITLIKQVLEKFFPLKNCPADTGLLLRGEPLVFVPRNKDRGYIVHQLHP